MRALEREGGAKNNAQLNVFQFGFVVEDQISDILYVSSLILKKVKHFFKF